MSQPFLEEVPGFVMRELWWFENGSVWKVGYLAQGVTNDLTQRQCGVTYLMKQ